MDEDISYETISFTLPWVGLWVMLLCGAIALTLILVAVVRVRRHRAHAERESRNVDPNLLHDTAIQRRIGYGFAVVAAIAAVMGVLTFLQDRAAFEGNVKAKYPDVVEVSGVEQTGMSFTADLTYADGSTAEDELIIVEPTGEPFYGDDILARPGDPEPLRAPGK